MMLKQTFLINKKGHSLFCLSLFLMFSGCGFQLKGQGGLVTPSARNQTIAITTTTGSKDMALALETHWLKNGGALGSLFDAKWQVNLQPVAVERFVLTRDQAGKAIEYQVETKVDFDLLHQGQIMVSKQAKTTRLLPVSNSELVASYQLEQEAMEQTYQTLADNILRQVVQFIKKRDDFAD